MLKVVLLLLLIPAVIKRESKVLVVIALLGFLYIYGVSETKNLSFSYPDYSEMATSDPGEASEEAL